jgi:hypothetical protein
MTEYSLGSQGKIKGRGTNLITIVVRDNGTPPLRATNRFTVRVIEVNEPPALTVPASHTVLPGKSVSFSVSATDGDLPANALSFSLGPGSPLGASLNAASGLFSWTPPATPVPGTNVFNFVVSDSGVPSLSNQRSVTLTVVPQPLIESITHNGGTVIIRWSALAGLGYRVQFKTTLDQPNWTDLSGDIVAAGTSATKNDVASGQRFYRVTVLP